MELARAHDPARARALERWLLGLVRLYADRVLPVTPAIADRWGRIAAARSLPVVDGLLAATALVHNLTLVTRNVGDVEGTGVRVLNPFSAEPHRPDADALLKPHVAPSRSLEAIAHSAITVK